MLTMFADPPSRVTHTLFFALQPPAAERDRITNLIGSLRLGGVPMRPDRLHISILALVLDDALPEGLTHKAAEVAASIRMPSFHLIFDRLVGGNRSALLRPSEPVEALFTFRERLGFALMSAGIAFEQSRFSPHVTLLYGGQPKPEIEIEPISWLVEDFVLIDSFIGETRHVEVGRWPLKS
ncbi:MAG TPA: 2'-5' RNA ligase family protein [Sphingomonas sp.]|nr:2'-5' RNA ligase family protein [Sphingomonas sp.]